MRQYPIASGYGTAIAAGDVLKFADGGSATTIEKESGTGDIKPEIEYRWYFHEWSYTTQHNQNIQHIISGKHICFAYCGALTTRMFCLLFRQTVRAKHE